jgi:hypothetical protein
MSIALDPASLQWRAPVCRVSYISRSCLPAGEGFGPPCVPRLCIMPPCHEGSGAATTCPAVSCGPQASNINKSLAGPPVQLGSYVHNARVPVLNAPDVRVIICLQNVQTCNYNVTRQCSAVWHSQSQLVGDVTR